MPDYDANKDHELSVKERIKLQRPPMYKVVLHNDDFTPMDFVVEILCRIFNKSVPVAFEIMLAVHHGGRGICGLYPREIAVTKMNRVHQLARADGHPLRCSIEGA